MTANRFGKQFAVAFAALSLIGTAAAEIPLPADYTPLDWMQSTGNEWIDTKYKPKANTPFVARIEGNFTKDTGEFQQMGALPGEGTARFDWGITGSDYGGHWTFAEATSGISSDLLNHVFVADYGNGVFSIDGNEVMSVSPRTQDSTESFQLFSRTNYAEQVNCLCYFRMRSCQLSQNGVLVRDYVPCRSSNGVVGLWDKVEGVFHTNVNSAGAFKSCTDRHEEIPLHVNDLRIRDPFVVAEDGTYFLYESKPWSGGKGVNVFESKDLVRWSERKSVMTIPETLANTAVWAPEVHRYRGKWYLFVTLTMKPGAWEIKPMLADGYKLGTLQPRGTWIYVADSPRGPFVPVKNGSVTPKEWMCLDGTFFEENGKPYMVFCHEWCQTGDGRMMLAELKPDLSGIVGEPKELFRASSVGKRFHVTDGPFIYRSPASGKLFMTWSNMGDGGYSVYLKTSESGSVHGPWRNAGKLFSKDGGHGMFFKDLAGRLQFVLHQPNKSPLERMKTFPVRETADTIVIGSAVVP